MSYWSATASTEPIRRRLKAIEGCSCGGFWVRWWNWPDGHFSGWPELTVRAIAATMAAEIIG